MKINTGSNLNNKYTVIKKLGKGAMGNVYLVKSKGSNNQFAIKKMDLNPESGLSEEKAKEIFFKEADFISRFNHTGLPKSYGNFIEEGSFFLIMEYIEGKTLEEIIDKELPLITEERAIKWTVELAEILYYLHNNFEAPIVYRDLKPTNIIITPKDYPRLIDFGISRYYNPDKNTDTFRLGSPGYAAPEQYKNMGQSSPQTDVFSLGVILFQLLTGYDPTLKPFKFPPMETLNLTVSDKLEKIVKRAIELKPLNRYISVSEFKEVLEKYLYQKKDIILSSPYSYSSREVKIFPEKKLKKKKAASHPQKPSLPKASIHSSLYAVRGAKYKNHNILMMVGAAGAVIFPALMVFTILCPNLCPVFLILIFILFIGLPFIWPELYIQLNMVSTGSDYLDNELHRAASKNNTAFAILLIDYGASINIENKEGRTPLYVASSHGHNSFIEFLLTEGADINKKETLKGNSPLHIAIKNRYRKTALILISKGADINSQNSNGEAPLHIAVKNRFTEVTEDLLDGGADTDIQDHNGDSPLHIAADCNNLHIAELLLKRGARKSLKNNNEQTPLDIARTMKYPDIKKILILN